MGGDGKVYVLSAACKLTVLKAQAQWEVMKVNELEDECFATPALADGGIDLIAQAVEHRVDQIIVFGSHKMCQQFLRMCPSGKFAGGVLGRGI